MGKLYLNKCTEKCYRKIQKFKMAKQMGKL